MIDEDWDWDDYSPEYCPECGAERWVSPSDEFLPTCDHGDPLDKVDE